MEKAKIIEKLIKESGYTIRSFALKCGMPESTLYTILKKGVGRASVDNVMTICRNLGIKVEDLEKMSGGAASPAEPSYEDIQSLIARKGSQLTNHQKKEIIKALLEDIED